MRMFAIADKLKASAEQFSNGVDLFNGLKFMCRESRAVDTESLCIISGKLVWAVRVDLHILDNGG